MQTRRHFLNKLSLSAAAAPFISGLSAFASPKALSARRQRLVVMFSPNGTVPWDFWPDEEGSRIHSQTHPAAAQRLPEPSACA
ncbi:MAG UNVERIFIED_CONTAM: hypothetical protein LVR18_29570 [Planctomycetaceae bacterium]